MANTSRAWLLARLCDARLTSNIVGETELGTIWESLWNQQNQVKVTISVEGSRFIPRSCHWAASGFIAGDELVRIITGEKNLVAFALRQLQLQGFRLSGYKATYSSIAEVQPLRYLS